MYLICNNFETIQILFVYLINHIACITISILGAFFSMGGMGGFLTVTFMAELRKSSHRATIRMGEGESTTNFFLRTK